VPVAYYRISSNEEISSIITIWEAGAPRDFPENGFD